MKKLIYIPIICFAISGCSLFKVFHFPIQPKTTLHMESLVVVSPDNRAWRSMVHNPRQLVMARNIANGSAVIKVGLINTYKFKSEEEFLKFNKDRLVLNDNPKRFKTIEKNYEQADYKGMRCSRFRTTAEDHGNKDIQYLKAFGYLCPYPNLNTIFLLEASHRSKNKEMPSKLEEEANSLFSNIKLKNNK